jgi:hypothetical protein
MGLTDNHYELIDAKLLGHDPGTARSTARTTLVPDRG